MAEVSRVQGPGGSPEQKKDKATADAEKFRELMKVQKISETDPEEQKKRKQQGEEDDEPSGDNVAAATTPLTPFSNTDQGDSASGKKVGGASSLGGKSSVSAPDDYNPSAEVADDDSDDETFMQTLPPPPPQLSTPAPTPQEVSPSDETEPDEPEEQVSSPQASTPQQTTPQQYDQNQYSNQPQNTSQQTNPSNTTGDKKVDSTSGKDAAALNSKKIGTPKPKIQNIKAGQPTTRDKTPSAEKGARSVDPTKKKEDTVQNPDDEAVAGPYTAPLASQQSSGDDKDQDKKDEKGMETDGVQQAATPAFSPDVAPIAGPVPSYAYLHPQVLQIFERMVGVITVMSNSGVTETTVTLNSPQFASSVFYGSQIIIKEFSSAPLALNVQLLGSPQAVALFQSNADDLMAAFKGGNYSFRINRLDTGILGQDKPLFKRKEAISGDEKGNDNS